MSITLQDSMDRLQAVTVDEIKKLHGETQATLQPFVPLEGQPDYLPNRVLSLEGLCKALEDLELESRNTARNQQILKSLYFPRFRTRHDQIEEAHEQTFRWVFQDHLPDTGQHLAFADWLQRKSGVFWVRGKAGAGKSTLMKFVTNREQTMLSLQEWAGQCKLAMAAHFFWGSGTEMQRSLEGLLCTLLFDILNTAPELIPLFENCLPDFKLVGNAAITCYPVYMSTQKHLLRTIKALLSHSCNLRFCFFIDGLDEFKGDTDALMDLIQLLNNNDNIKICVSSRPWTEFRDAFGNDEDRLIKLEDLTRSDIRNYTADFLSKHPRFHQLKDLDDRYQLLVDKVAQRAQGVFLWVFLVVRSLLEGIRYADTVEDMQLRLEAFPPDLEGFFKRMLYEIPRLYRRKTAQTFQLAITAEVPLPLMIYSFADDMDVDPLFAISGERRPMATNEIYRRNEELLLRLDGRSKGLLEAVLIQGNSDFFRFEVHFLHRTVRDFLLCSQDVHDMFDIALPRTFQPSAILCSAYLALLKAMPEHRLTASNELAPSIEGFFHFASRVQESKNKPDHWPQIVNEANLVLVSTEMQLPLREDSKSAEFIAMAIHAGLVEFVDNALAANCQSSRRPFLEYALQIPWDKRRFPERWQYSPQLVRCLLKHKERPNEKTGTGTLWTDFLRLLYERPEIRTDAAFEVLKILAIEGRAILVPAVPITPQHESQSRFATLRDIYSVNYEEEPPLSPENPFDFLRQIAPPTVVAYIVANVAKASV